MLAVAVWPGAEVSSADAAEPFSLDAAIDPDELIRDHYEDRLGQNPYLAQAQPQPDDGDGDREDQPRAEPPSRRPQRRSVFRLARVPNMFGDLGGGPGGQAVVGPQTFTQTVTDGNPIDLFVSHFDQAQGGILPGGPLTDPNTPVTVTNGPGGPVVTQSVGLGMDQSGDGQPDTYSILPPTPILGAQPPFPGAQFDPNKSNLVFVNNMGEGAAAQNGSHNEGDGWNMNLVFNVPQLRARIRPGGRGVVRQVKLAENNSPQPRDRFVFNFNYFNGVTGGVGDITRYIMGFEKAFFNQAASVEFRMPFTATLASDQIAGGATLKDLVTGNLTVAGKFVVHQTPSLLTSVGLAAGLPTAADTRVLRGDGVELLNIRNESVHLTPFLAFLSTPNDWVFCQSFIQFDFDVNGNRVRGDRRGERPTQIGIWNDAALMFIDLNAGFWLYQNPLGCVTRVAPMLELHYVTRLQDTDLIDGNGLTITDFDNRFDVLNLTLATAVFLHDTISIRPAVVLPLLSYDRHFNYEAGVQVNVFF